jgi:hypothetical protein
MANLTLAVNVNLGAELSDEELASLTEALLRKLTKHSIETIEDELGDTHRGLKGSVTIDHMVPVSQNTGE